MSKDYYQYTNYHLEPGGLTKLDFIVDFIKEKFNDKKIAILDVGCGRGNIALPLASLGHQVTAIDAFQPALRELENKQPPANLKIQNVAFEKFNTADQYKVIIMSEFLEHTANPDAVLKSVKTLLTANGILILTVPNGLSLEELIRRFSIRINFLRKMKIKVKRKFFEEAIQSSAESPHLHFWSYFKIKKFLRQQNLEIVEIKVINSFIKEFYYLVGRFFITRGSSLFRLIDRLDNFIIKLLPKPCGSNWLIVLKK